MAKVRNVSQLSQIAPALSLYYSFHKTSTSPSAYPESEQALEAERLGPAAALSELHRQGCNLATKEWVENHWGLILWKLAGLVMLDPEKEVANNSNKRWCWDEVMRQLHYRYVFFISIQAIRLESEDQGTSVNLRARSDRLCV